MSDYCKQCLIEMFGPGLFDDLAGITTPEDMAAGKACIAICEGCGYIQVDPEGACISSDCYSSDGAKHAECTCGSMDCKVVKHL